MAITAIGNKTLTTLVDQPPGSSTVTAIGKAGTENVTVGNFTTNGTLTAGGAVAVTGNVSATGNVAATGNVSAGGTLSATGQTSPSGGLNPAVGTAGTVFHSGRVGATSATMGTDTTPVNTETYIVEINIDVDTTLTGVSILNGSAVAGNMKFSLADSTGAPIAAAQTASTAQSGTAAFQQVPFVTPYVVKGPQKLFVLAQFDTNTTPRYRSHAVGNFGAAKKTGETYGTFTAVTPPTTFTANLGPVCDVY